MAEIRRNVKNIYSAKRTFAGWSAYEQGKSMMSAQHNATLSRMKTCLKGLLIYLWMVVLLKPYQ